MSTQLRLIVSNPDELKEKVLWELAPSDLELTTDIIINKALNKVADYMATACINTKGAEIMHELDADAVRKEVERIIAARFLSGGTPVGVK